MLDRLQLVDPLKSSGPQRGFKSSGAAKNRWNVGRKLQAAAEQTWSAQILCPKLQMTNDAINSIAPTIVQHLEVKGR